jgi:hypothetical protein
MLFCHLARADSLREAAPRPGFVSGTSFCPWIRRACLCA